MTELKKYYTLKEAFDNFLDGNYLPYNAPALEDIAEELELSLTNYPVDLTDTYIKEMWETYFSRYYDYYIIGVVYDPFHTESSNLNNTDMLKWFTKFLNVLTMTYPYYSILLKEYASAKLKLMDDLKTTSTNKVGFNETPQNPNTAGVYEGDDYLTNFTKSTGETSTPLNSKIMRLKEIQDNYKRVMADWIKEFDCLILFNIGEKEYER